MAGLWDDLAAALADPVHFADWWALDHAEVLHTWAALEENSDHRVTRTYAATLRTPDAGVDYGPGLARLLELREFHDEAQALRVARIEHARRGDDPATLQAALGDYVRGRVSTETRAASQERLRICRELGDLDALQDALLEEAGLRFWHDDLMQHDDGAARDACRLLREQRRLCRLTGNLHGLQRSLHERAWMLFVEGRPGPMPRLLALQERLCREIGEREDLCTCLMAQAHVFSERVDTRPRARACVEEGAEIAAELGWRTMITAALKEKAVLALLEGDAAGAERLVRAAGNASAGSVAACSLEHNLTVALEYRKVELDAITFPRGARDAYLVAERFARAAGDPGCLQWALGRLARELGTSEPDKALELATEREAICRQLERAGAHFDALETQASLLLTLDRPTEALAVLHEQTEMCRHEVESWRLPTVQQARRCALRAAILRCADLESARALHKELELVCRELGDRPGASAAARGRKRLLRKPGRAPRPRLAVLPGQLSLKL